MVLGIDMDSFNDQKKEAAQKFLHNIHDELQAELEISKKTINTVVRYFLASI